MPNTVRQRRLVVLDCCGQRFSKIVDHWTVDPSTCDTEIPVEIDPALSRMVTVYLFLPAGHPSGPHKEPTDVVFATSQDELLFEELCDRCTGGRSEARWYEEEGAATDLF